MPILNAPPEMSLALDTDVFTHLRNGHEFARQKLVEYQKVTKRFPAITSITVFELIYGCQNALTKGLASPEQELSHRQSIFEFVNQCTVLSFDRRAAEIAGYVFAKLKQKEKNKHWRDV